MLFLVIVSVIILFVASIKLITFLEKRKEKRDKIKQTDEKIEKLLMNGLNKIKIEHLSQHTDKSKIAEIVSSRIEDYLQLAIHPFQLSKIFENLGLYTHKRDHYTEREIELSALIKQNVLQSIDRHDLKAWNSMVCSDKKLGYDRINSSFLVKAENSMLVWDLNLS